MSVKKIIGTVLNVDVAQIQKDSGPGSLPGWDSLKHIEIVMAIESAENIKFSGIEVASLTSYGNIESLVNRKKHK